jgi:preprotein translocase subunit SecA
VDARNFDIRTQLLEYDDVANDQRKEIYRLRNEVLDSSDITEMLASLREAVVTDMFRAHIPEESVEEQWDVPTLQKLFAAELLTEVPLTDWVSKDPEADDAALLERTLALVEKAYKDKVSEVNAEAFHQFERSVMLQSLDSHWREHLAALDHLRQGIHLRGYAQKNPKQEYKREAFELFSAMLESIKLEVTKTLVTVRIRSDEDVAEAPPAPALENVQYHHADYDEALAASPDKTPLPAQRNLTKVGRNDPCPCGSGRKYKHCHGRLT